MPSPDFLALNPELAAAGDATATARPLNAGGRSTGRKRQPRAQKPVQRVKAGSARARCVECGAIIGKGRKAATCAPCDLVAIIARAGLPAPLREVRFAWPERKWSADLGWPERGVLCEVDGGQFVAGGGRHNTDTDRDKLNNAAARGWRVVRFSPQQIERDPVGCVELIRRCLELKR